jgi:glycosyltransferase involved in cell wall biosynthesis
VIVVDDGSETSPAPVVDSFQNCLKVTLISQSHAGPAAARNTGAAQAKGEFLAFTDDDCAPASNWLQSLAVRFAESPRSAIAGRTVNALPENPYATASQLLIDYLHAYYNINPDRACFLTSNNVALSTDHFRGIGGFDTTFGRAAAEDREFCDRWLHCGYQVICAPEVLVHHAHALTFQTFLRQHFNYGRGAFCFHRLRARRRSGGVELEPLSFYLNLLEYPFLQSQTLRMLPCAALMTMSQMANAAGYYWEQVNPTQWSAIEEPVP